MLSLLAVRTCIASPLLPHLLCIYMIVRGREQTKRGEEGKDRIVRGKEVGKRDRERDRREEVGEGGREKRKDGE